LSNDSDYLSNKFDEYFDAADAVDNFSDVASEEVSFSFSTSFSRSKSNKMLFLKRALLTQLLMKYFDNF
jgi:hypothetical protein